MVLSASDLSRMSPSQLTAMFRRLETQQYSLIEAEVHYLRELAVVNRMADNLTMRRSVSELFAQSAREGSQAARADATWMIESDLDMGIRAVYSGAGGTIEQEQAPPEVRDMYQRLAAERPSMPLLCPSYSPSNREGLYMGLQASTPQHFVGALILYFDDPTLANSGHQTRVLQTLMEQVAVACEHAKLLEAMGSMIIDVVVAMAMAVESRDPYTGGHIFRVTAYSVMLGEKLGLGVQDLMVLRLGGLLHDIGKVAVPDDILRKPGRLTDEEMQVMRSHATVGHAIVSSVPQLASTCDIVRHHHERYDGLGYPDKLTGEQTPQLARIAAVADAFDAMTSDRPYRKGMETDIALDEIRKCAGKQFDPIVAEAFLDGSADRFQNAITALETWRAGETRSSARQLLNLLSIDLPRIMRDGPQAAQDQNPARPAA